MLGIKDGNPKYPLHMKLVYQKYECSIKVEESGEEELPMSITMVSRDYVFCKDPASRPAFSCIIDPVEPSLHSISPVR